MTPAFLSIAGSDCSAGAGLQADLKTGSALGCYTLTAVTCVVSEVPGKVDQIVAMDPDFVASQVRLCLQSFPVASIKLGMLYSPEIVEAVAEEIKGAGVPVVTDPVMIATAGEPLMQEAAIRAYEQLLIPCTSILTPNLDELQRLIGAGAPITTPQKLEEAALGLAKRYGCNILAKGGHLDGETCIDILAQPDGAAFRWSHPRTNGISTHGTGCTLSSAIAACLACGQTIAEAVAHGLHYTAKAIADSRLIGPCWLLRHEAANSGKPCLE